MKSAKFIIPGIAAIVCAFVLGNAYTYKFRAQDTVVVTGLGETEFASDLIVWSGAITAEAANAAAGYAQIETSKRKVQEYLAAKGIPAKAVVFDFVNVNKQFAPVYNANGSWAGQRFTGYELRQRFGGGGQGRSRLARDVVAHRAGRLDRSLSARLLLHAAR